MGDKRMGTCVRIVALLAIVCATMFVDSCAPISTRTRPPSAGGTLDTTKKDTARVSDEDLVRVRWLSIHGIEGESSPPILRLAQPGQAPEGIGSDALVLTLDMRSPTLPSPILQLVHCDRNWVPTESIFIQDVVKLRSDNFRVQRVSSAVRYYDYTLDITFPRADQNLRIERSGNYKALVLDYYDRNKILGEGRFFVVESKSSVQVSVTSDFYESGQTKTVQRGLRVRVEATPTIDMYGTNINGIHLIEDSHWYQPTKAEDMGEGGQRTPGKIWTMWDSFFGSHTIAQFLNVPAGNEYRQLNLTDLSLFPVTGGAVSTPLSDLPRSSIDASDYNGAIHPRIVDLRDDDYVYFEFRLDLKGREAKQDVFVVGTFNNWKPSPEWQLQYEPISRFYVVRGWIKRAYHEYEYVAGDWDEDTQVLRGAESTLLEGNISLSTHSFAALVYYHDITLGGFDRIIGVGKTEGTFW